MGDNPVGHKIPDGAKALAEHIRWVAQEDGKVADGMVEWNEYVMLEEPLREALVMALQDLYIDPFETVGIMQRTNDLNRTFVNRLITNLRTDPPLFKVAERFCSQDRMDIKIRNALEFAAQEDLNPQIQERAQQILESCKILFAKLDE